METCIVQDKLRGMWNRQPKFKAAVLAYRKEHSLRPEEFAPLLGLTPNGLHGLLYDKRSDQPELSTAQSIVRVLGGTLSDWVDDPGRPVPGAADGADPLDKALLEDIGRKFKDLTDDQKLLAANAIRSMLDAVRSK